MLLTFALPNLWFGSPRTSQWQTWRHHLEYVGAAVLVAADRVPDPAAPSRPGGSSGEPAADVVPD